MNNEINVSKDVSILDDEALKKIYAGNDPTTVNISVIPVEPD